ARHPRCERDRRWWCAYCGRRRVRQALSEVRPRDGVCFFGDGASNQGALFEAANTALWRLPCIFVCENNGYAEFPPQRSHQAIQDLCDRAHTWGIPGVIVDGMDAVAM